MRSFRHVTFVIAFLALTLLLASYRSDSNNQHSNFLPIPKSGYIQLGQKNELSGEWTERTVLQPAALEKVISKDTIITELTLTETTLFFLSKPEKYGDEFSNTVFNVNGWMLGPGTRLTLLDSISEVRMGPHVQYWIYVQRIEE